jgi:putative transposase
MRKRRFTVGQIIGVLKQAEVGVPVAEVIRKAGISEQTFYGWKAKYAGLEVDQVRQIAQLQALRSPVLGFKRCRRSKKS